MLLAVIHLGYQHILRRFAQNVFFPNAFHFHVHRHARRDFGDTVVQARLYVGLSRAPRPIGCLRGSEAYSGGRWSRSRAAT